MNVGNSMAQISSGFNLCRVDLDWILGHTCHAALSLLLLVCTGDGNYNEKLVGRDKDRDRQLTNYGHRQTRLNLGR